MGSHPGVNQAGASGLGWSRWRLHLQRSFAASPRQIEGSATAAPVGQSVKRTPIRSFEVEGQECGYSIDVVREDHPARRALRVDKRSEEGE